MNVVGVSVINDPTSWGNIEALLLESSLGFIKNKTSFVLEIQNLTWQRSRVKFSFLRGVCQDGDEFVFHGLGPPSRYVVVYML